MSLEVARRIAELIDALAWIEGQVPCPCGADPRHRDAHPHADDCPVASALLLDNGHAITPPKSDQNGSDRA